MFDYDKSNFISFLYDFPRQATNCLQLMEKVKDVGTIAHVENIVLAGMGGSAISGDLLLAYLQDELQLPALVNREYSLPAFVNQKTLFIASSYSGNTEETLSAFEEARRRGAMLVGISSGGQLEEKCKEAGCLHIKLPTGFPPRQALGYLFFPLLILFEKWELISPKNDELLELTEVLEELKQRLDPRVSMGNNLANHIAQTVYKSIPVIYTAVPFFYPIPVRWRNQFNENSKVMAFSNVFPELNHNEIMGWEGPPEVNKLFRVILLRDREESPRNKQRVEITKSIIKSKNIPILEIFAEGRSRLARMFSLIYTGDWASYYLAMLNEKDPIRIDSITLLKEKLSQLPLKES